MSAIISTANNIASIIGVSDIEDKRRGAKLLIATNLKNKGFEIRVEVEPEFSHDGTCIELIFELAVRRGVEKFRRVSISESVIQLALKDKADVVVAAIDNQFSWFEANYPELGGQIFKLEAEQVVVQGSSGRKKPPL